MDSFRTGTALIVLLLGACAPGAGREVPPEPAALEGPCPAWSGAVEIGALDPAILDEASGLEISPRFPERLYHVNDSGDPGGFFISRRTGAGLRRVTVEGFHPFDAEGLTLGDCGRGTGTCLFIGDIGDNGGIRDSVEIVLVEEREVFPASVAPLHRFRVRYEGGAEDAESLAVHPDGDIYILTKNADYTRLSIGVSNVYRIRREAWIGAGAGPVTAELAGRLDLVAISSDPFSGSLPTAMDIHDDGTRFLVMTYNNVFEFEWDLSVGPWKETTAMTAGVDYREIPLETLEQQETVAYEPGGRAFVYGTEFIPTARAGGRARLMRVVCGD